MAAYSPGGHQIATAGEQGVIRFWDTSGKLVNKLEGHKKNIVCLAFHPGGKRLATGSADKTVRVWDMAR